MRIGALWGIGHGASAILLGLTAFFLKGQFTGRFAVMEKLATAAESVVGLSILFIGLMGIRESLEQGHEEDPTSVPAPALSAGKAFDLMNLLPVGASTARLAGVSTTSTPSTPFDASTSAGSKNGKPRTYAAIVANGMLHGFSWDGAPSLAPAIAMSSWRGAFTFLLAYSLGTIVTMSLAAGAMGELSTRVGQATNNPDLPRKLSLVSSVAAVLIGVYMTAKSTILR